MRRSFLLGCLRCVIVFAAGPALAADPAPTGEWRTANGWANIRIVNCAGALWGVVAWESMQGGRDTKNPDPALRGRPMLRAPILIDMKPNRDRWEGQVYNSENGNTYMANIRLLNPNTLRIEGCVLGG